MEPLLVITSDTYLEVLLIGRGNDLKKRSKCEIDRDILDIEVLLELRNLSFIQFAEEFRTDDRVFLCTLDLLDELWPLFGIDRISSSIFPTPTFLHQRVDRLVMRLATDMGICEAALF